MSSSLELSKRLRALDDAQLTALIERRIASSSGITDYFDLADALLAPSSLSVALQRFQITHLQELRGSAPFSPELSSALEQELLLSQDGSVFPEVSTVLAQLPELGEAPQRKNPPSELSDMQAAAALEFAFATISSAEDLVEMLEGQPAKQLAKGGLSSPDTQRLAPVLPSPLITLEDLLTLAERAGATSLRSGWWVPGAQTESWKQASLLEKWLTLAEGFLRMLPPAVREILLTHEQWDELDAWVDATYPLGHEWLDDDLHTALTHAHLLGLAQNNLRTPLGTAVFSADIATARSLVEQAIPPFATHVFVQLDHSVIAPGPLRPEAERFMRLLGTVESRGVATTYRITPAGITSAIESGLAAKEIVNTLTELAGTALPQAVAYLITETGEKYGSLTVQDENTHSLIRVTDTLVAQTIAADRSLTALGLTLSDEHTLRSVHAPEIVTAALQDSRYPAQLVSASGEPVKPRRVTIAADEVASAPSPAEILLSRLRGSRAESANDDATWIARQLDLAVRNKTALVVTVNMPDGLREFTVEPRGFSNGRFRCLDRNTDVERTLPASHITAVRYA